MHKVIVGNQIMYLGGRSPEDNMYINKLKEYKTILNTEAFEKVDKNKCGMPYTDDLRAFFEHKLNELTNEIEIEACKELILEYNDKRWWDYM